MQSSPLHLGRLCVAISIVTAVVIGAGAYPTHRLAGLPGLAGMAIAALSVLVVMAFSAGVAAWMARHVDTLRAAQSFMVVGTVRLALCVGLALTGRWALELPLPPTLIWVALLYLPLLAVEGWWLGSALKKIERPNEVNELRHEHDGRY